VDPVKVPIFDLDGTLVDSDEALLAPFLALGVERQAIPPLGMLLEDACSLGGITVADYLAAYDPSLVRPFPGAAELIEGLARWAVCSHKLRAAGTLELDLLGWQPERAMFAEDFGGRPKHLDALLNDLRLDASNVVFVGDTQHDRACAEAAGVTFVLAGWNSRAETKPGDVRLSHPSELLELL
jgi:phosphoglycolate phosphatase-like HAD superfamily hydrolase